MSYSDWLNSIGNIIPTIIGWITSLTNSLLSNYIVVTILGFILFSSFFYLIINLLFSMKKDHKTDYDNIK